MRSYSTKNITSLYPIKPNNQRISTDRYCLILYAFLSFVVLSAFFYSFVMEKDANFLYPTDPNGRSCGLGEYSQYPYIYFPDPSPSPQSLQKAVCVSSCPSTQTQLSNSNIKCLSNSKFPSCQQHINRYPTKKNSYRSFCEPVSEKLRDALNENLMQTSSINHWIFELEKLLSAKFAICVLCPSLCIFVMLIELFLVYCYQNIKGLFIINFIVLFAILLYFGFRLIMLTGEEEFNGSKVLGIMIIVVSLLVVAYVLGNLTDFRKSLEYLNICAEFILENKRIIFLPLAMFTVWAFSFAAALTVLTYIQAISSQKVSSNFDYVSPFQINRSDDKLVGTLFILSLVHYIWTCLIIQHLGKYVAIVGASNWMMHTPRHFKNALYTLFKYHLGSAFLGSVMITFLSWLAQLFYFFVPDYDNNLLFCKCPNWNGIYKSRFFEKYIGSHTQMTYLQIGLDGEDFYEAGRELSPFLVQNIKSLTETHKLSKLIIKSCQLFVASLVTIICYEYLMRSVPGFNSLLTISIIFFISYLLASFGQDPYNQAYESLLLTVIINKGRKNEKVDRAGIAEFSSAKSIATDGRLIVYEKIEQWLFEQNHRPSQKAHP